MDKDKSLNELLAMQPRRPVTRRELLRRAGIGAGAVSVTALMAACGVSGEAERNQDDEEQNTLTTSEENGVVNFANWPAYIDKSKGTSPTLDQFEKETGIEVNYKESINDNLSFYATIREPLANDEATQWDIVVLTDWLVGKMIRLGYLEELDKSLLPNYEEHLGEIYRDPTYDPGRKYSAPWASGITGIAYNPDLTGREITSVNDLFDPQYKGKVGMFTEMRDTMHLTMLSFGVAPEDATTEDARKAQEKLLQQRDQGIVRQYYGNDYVQPLAQGDLALCIAWSGDVLGKTLGANSPIRFVVPEEGGMLWTDNMLIPENAENPIDAHKMIDFVYEPKIAAQMCAWINYIPPVPEAREIMLSANDSYTRQVAKSPLVFPTPEMEANVYSYKNLSDEEEAEWNDLFNEVLQG